MKNEMNTADNMQDRVVPVATTENETDDYINKVEANETKEEGMKANNEDSKTGGIGVMAMVKGNYNNKVTRAECNSELIKPVHYLRLNTGKACLLHLKENKPETDTFFGKFILDGSGTACFEGGCFLDLEIEILDSASIMINLSRDGIKLVEYLYTDSFAEMGKGTLRKIPNALDEELLPSESTTPYLSEIIKVENRYSEIVVDNLCSGLISAWRRIRRLKLSRPATFAQNREHDLHLIAIQVAEARHQDVIKLQSQKEKLKEANNELAKQLKSFVRLQQEIQHLRKDASVKDEQIKILKATNSGLLAEIEQRVDAQVSETRKKDEELEYRNLELEEERDALKNSIDNLEHALRDVEQLLINQGVSFESSFMDVDNKNQKAITQNVV